MTLTKQTLSEALAVWDGGESSRWNDPHTAPWVDLDDFVAAARFVERLLPEKCKDCEGTGRVENSIYLGLGRDMDCDTCHGNGQLWDEGLVEVVARLLYDTCFVDGGTLAFYQDRARAVLAALAEEVGK